MNPTIDIKLQVNSSKSNKEVLVLDMLINNILSESAISLPMEQFTNKDYLIEDYKASIEKLNKEIDFMQSIQENSKIETDVYKNAVMVEIELQKEKLKVLNLYSSELETKINK